MSKLKYLVLLLLPVLFVSFGCSTEDVSNNESEGPAVPDLRAWLDENSSLKASIKLEQDNGASPSYWYGGTLTELAYDSWPEADKTALDEAFSRVWINLYVTKDRTALGAEEFTMPIACTTCDSRLQSTPTAGPFTPVTEAVGKAAFIAYVAHSLAVEIGQGVSWSIVSAQPTEWHHYFNSRSIAHRLGSGYSEFFVGNPGGPGDAREKYLGNSSPATPIFVYNWMFNNSLIGTTHETTIHNVLDWFRSNAIHYYGGGTLQNHQDHWGYPGQVSAYHLINGTIRATETEAKHWTAGCHGTAGFIKSAMKAVNIPVEIIYTCGHAQLYFPTIDRYLDHGDNPYNLNVSGQMSKPISGIMLDSATYTTRFTASPDQIPPGNPACSYIGQAAADF